MEDQRKVFAVLGAERWRGGEGEGEGVEGHSEEEAESEPAHVHVQVGAVTGKRSYQWRRCRSS